MPSVPGGARYKPRVSDKPLPEEGPIGIEYNGDTVNVETVIRESEWWRRAQEMLDRHYDPSDVAELLEPVALLHDIGKTKDDKETEGEHPITGKAVKMRHPIMGVIAAMEILPNDLAGRDTILALIEEHDTPYSWYRQFRKTGQVPKRKSWARLDRKIDPQEDGTGLVLLSVFKLADIDGHENVEDVPWFMEQAHAHYLREKGKWLPVPERDVIQSLAGPADWAGPGSLL